MRSRGIMLCAAAASILVAQLGLASDHRDCELANDRIVCTSNMGTGGDGETDPAAGETPNTGGAAEQPPADSGELAEVSILGQPVFFRGGPSEEQLIGDISELIRDDHGQVLAVTVDVAGAENEVSFPIGHIEARDDPSGAADFRLYFEMPMAMANGPSSGAVRTSRSFVGPQQFPPEEFAAYGIVAFPARAVTESGRQRHLDACRAYIATLPTPSELSVPPEEQMVTVWPVDDAQLGADLTGRTDTGVCDTAVERYHLETALTARNHARLAGGGALNGRGPFLLAWSPSSHKGREDALVLIADLSSATSFEHFEGYFRQWREDIEQSPELWENGWSLSLVRTRIRDWADRWGSTILTLRGE